MKLTQAQIDAMTGQITFLLEDTYKKFNEEVVKRQEQAYETAASKVPEVKEFIEEQGRGRSYNPHDQTFRNFLLKKFPEDFRAIPPQKNLQNTRNAIRRDIVIVAPECKTTDEVLARVTAKYVI